MTINARHYQINQEIMPIIRLLGKYIKTQKKGVESRADKEKYNAEK